MKVIAPFLLILLITSSCIPTRIAPRIETNKVVVAKKFKRGLPKQHSFVFEDPKNANHFYNYINTKYQRNHIYVESNVPFIIDKTTYYLSFYETEIQDETINLIPIIIDTKLEHDGGNSIFDDFHTSRKGNYYIVLTVSDDDLKDCISENYKNREVIIQFLEKIRIEYLKTYNYEELLFKKKS